MMDKFIIYGSSDIHLCTPHSLTHPLTGVTARTNQIRPKKEHHRMTTWIRKKIRKIKTIQAQKKDDRPDHRPPCTICHGHCTWAAARPVSYVSLFIYLIFLFIFLFRFRPISISAAFPVSYVFIYICYFYFHNLIGSLDFGSVQDHLKNLHNSIGIFISQNQLSLNNLCEFQTPWLMAATEWTGFPFYEKNETYKLLIIHCLL